MSDRNKRAKLGQMPAGSATSAQLTSRFSDQRLPKLPETTVQSVAAAVVGAFKLIEYLANDVSFKNFCDVSGKSLPPWHKDLEGDSGRPAAAYEVVTQLQISDKFEEIISTIPENSEWIPPADTPNHSLVLKMRQKLADWETLFRYRGEKNLSSGCIDPVLILNFLHEKQDVKSFLDVGMGAAGPLAVAFTYFSFRIHEGIQDVFKIFGTEILLQKFVKAHILLTAISKTIARMKSKSLAGWKSISSEEVAVQVHLQFRPSLFNECNVCVFSEPDCILFNNQEIESVDLHRDVLKVQSKYLLSIKLNHYDFTKVKFHLAGMFSDCASFRDANLIVFRKFDDNQNSFLDMASNVTRWIRQLPAQKFSEVQASVWNLFKSFAEPGTKIKNTFESIISKYFGEFLEDWSISEFYFYCPPVLMSTILFCLSELLADSFASEEQKNGDFSPHLWFVEQRNSSPDIFRAWAHVESKIFTGTHERNCFQGDISFWQTDAQWYSHSGFIPLLKSLSRKQTLWSGYFHLKPIVPLAPFSSIPASSSNSSGIGSSNSSTSISSGSSYQPPSHASEVKLDVSTDQHVMFLQGENNILDYLENKPDLLPEQKKRIKKMFAHIKSMSITILDKTFPTILATFLDRKQLDQSAKASKQVIESKKNVTSNVGSSSLSSKNVGDSISPPAADRDLDVSKQLERGRDCHSKVQASLPRIDPDLESEDESEDESESEDQQYIWNNCQPKQRWNLTYLRRSATLLEAFNIQRAKLLELQDSLLLSTNFLKNVYSETTFRHSVGQQWYGIMVNEPYSGHNHTLLSKSGIRYFQNLGLCDRYQGVHQNIQDWKNAVKDKHWSFVSVQFINASFLCINFAEDCNQEQEDSSDEPHVNVALQSTVADQLGISNFIVSPCLQKLTGSAKKSWTLVSIEAIDRNEKTLETVEARFFVITRTQIIVFKLQSETGGSHNIDLSRAVVKFEDLLANMIFHGHINDMHANLHFHLKLFYSKGYRVAQGKKRNNNSGNDYEDDYEEQDFLHDSPSPHMAQPTVFNALEVFVSNRERMQRDGAQAFLKEQLEQSDTTYRETLARELVDENKPVQVRQVAGTLLKNTLFAKDTSLFARQIERYARIPEASRQNVKMCTFKSLLSPYRDVRAAAASAACHIAIAELSINPSIGEEFLGGLVHLAEQTHNKEVCGGAEAALKCIGYFTERAEEVAVQVDVTKTNMILTVVVGALVGKPDGVRLAALSALNHILPFAKNNFAVEGERDHIIQLLHDCAVQVPPYVPPGAVIAQPNSASICESALECCARIIELYYDKIDHNFFAAIFNITTTALDLKTNTPDEVMLQAINFWSTLALVEYHYEHAAKASDMSVVSKHYALIVAGNLLPLLLTCLHGKGRNYRDDDPNAEDENNSPYTAAAECIGNFASLLKSDILPLVTPFLANLRSKDWKARKAALYAFAKIMDGPVESPDPAKDIATVISHYLQPDICPLLLDESSHAVRHSAAFAFGSAVKFFPYVVLRVYETADKFYLAMVQTLEPVRLSAKDSRTVEFYLWSLREMVLAVNEKYPEQHMLPGSEIIFEALLVTAVRPDSSQSLSSLSFEVLCDFIRCSSIAMLPHIMQHLFPNIMERLFAVINAPLSSQIDASALNVVAAKLVSVFGSICTRFSLTTQATSELAAFLQTIMDNQLSMADNVVTLLFQALPGDAELEGGSICAEEVVMAAAQMSKIISADFEKYLAALNPKFLLFMRSVHAGDLAYITCTSIGDIVRSIGPPITRSNRALLEWLYYASQLVASPESDANYGVTSLNSVRSIAINLVSVIVMEIGSQINDQYREQIMAALFHAHGQIQSLLAQMAQQQFKDDDIEYTKNLISNVLGLWMALSQAHQVSQQAQSGVGQVFAQYVPQVLACITFADQFTQWLAADDSRGDPAFILGSCANLVKDVARCLGPAVTEQLRGTSVVAEVLQVSGIPVLAHLAFLIAIAVHNPSCCVELVTPLQRLSRCQDSKSQEKYRVCQFILDGGR